MKFELEGAGWIPGGETLAETAQVLKGDLLNNTLAPADEGAIFYRTQTQAQLDSLMDSKARRCVAKITVEVEWAPAAEPGKEDGNNAQKKVQQVQPVRGSNKGKRRSHQGSKTPRRKKPAAKSNSSRV